jgi:general secretion pathway protein D
LSDRQAQIQIGNVLPVLKGVNPLALVRPGITKANENDPAPFLIEQMFFGTTLDIVPHLSADGYTIHLTAIPKITAFLGNAKPTTNVTVYLNGKKQTVPAPQPQFYSDSLTNSATVWDGQTLVMGGLISESQVDATDKAPGFLSRVFRSKSSKTIKKNVMVFITPTLIDAAGNRIHTEEDMPFATNNIPAQPK